MSRQLATVAPALLAAFGALLAAGSQRAMAAETVGTEYAVKAAIVYKIAKFVSWPEHAFQDRDEPLSICLLADDPIAPAMQGLAGDTVHGRPIEITMLREAADEPADCEVLFVSSSSSRDPGELLGPLRNQPVLTVGDDDEFIGQGGIVSLKVRQNRVQFAINVEASADAGLGISAQLLQIAGLIDKPGGSR